MARQDIFSDLRSLGGKAVIYGAGSVLLRSLTFFLLPLYTQFLSKEDYGLVGIATTISGILIIVLPLSIHGSLTKCYFASPNEEERRQSTGSIWIASLASSITIAAILDCFGSQLSERLFQSVPFSPVIRSSIWIAFFTTLGLIPLNLLQVRERPLQFVLLNVLAALLTTGLVIWYVVLKKEGVAGYLRGSLLSGAFMGAVFILIALRNSRLTLRWSIIKPALAYSLPLIPHGVGGWILASSDRIILERFVPLGQVGVYHLGYQLASALTLIAVAFNTAWTPFLFKADKERGQGALPDFARISTYYAVGLTWAALCLSLLSRHVLLLLTAPAYHPAESVIPWIVGGMLLNGLYIIPVGFLFLRSRTGWIPIGTLASGIASVGLNLFLVPKLGILAAAISVLVANFVLLVVISVASYRTMPLPYEWRRLMLMLLLAGALLAGGSAITLTSPLLEGLLRATLGLAFPILLFVFRFFTASERSAIMKRLCGLVHPKASILS